MSEKTVTLTGWLTVKQAAELKGVTMKAVYNRIRAGLLSKSRMGHAVVIRKSELDRWEVNRTIQEANRETWRKKKEDDRKSDLCI